MKKNTLICLPALPLLALASMPTLADWQAIETADTRYPSRPAFDRVNRQYVSTITVQNTSETNLTGPIRVLLDASSHALANASGEVGGTPYLTIDVDTLAPGQSASVVGRFELKRARFSLDLSVQSFVEDSSGTGLALEQNQIAVFYSREDGQYDGWGLHLWNGQACGNYAEPTTQSSHFSNWPDPYPADGIHPEYGAYYVLTVEPGADCYNFIVHKGNDKALGSADSRFEPEFGNQAFTFNGFPELWYTPITSRPQFLDGARAHWMDDNTLLWLTNDGDAADIALYYSSDASLDAESAGVSLLNVGALGSATRVPMTLDIPEQTHYDTNPHLNGFTGFTFDVSEAQAKLMLTGQLVAVAKDADGNILDSTRVQTPRVLDYLYTRTANDADEAKLGVSYSGNDVTTSVWAPTAQSVSLKVYNKAKVLQNTYPMVLDAATGVWHHIGQKSDLDRQFYRYELTVFHPLTQNIEVLETTDPYSVSLSTNGRFTQFVNLNDADLKPAGWDNHVVPASGDPEDIIIYESHIRDFSILDESTSPENRGKYMAFTESNSVPVKHLQSLQNAGLTHFHMLPANDIATIREDAESRVDVTDTVARLCSLNAEAPVCSVENDNSTLLDVLKSYSPDTTQAQALVESMRGFDGFNWGYDPHHFAAPEGSYATDPDGEARIVEMRAMNQALHEMGLRVVLDVVYNHTASSGLFDNSVLDKVVPGYYQRLNETTGRIENSTCCENTATEHTMMAKLMNDSLVSFAEHFGFDSFRFDLMGHIPKQAILDAREAVRAVDPDTYFYGEGWNFGEVVNNRRFEQAAQLNMAGSEIGTFSDRQREAVRSAALFNAGGSLHDQDTIRIGLVGNVGSYQFVAADGTYLSAYDYNWNGQPAGYSEDPADTVNYISKHDNEALWDQLQYGLPSDMTVQDRVRVQNVALSIPLLSQGIPFMHMGSELIRSKSMDRNTYDAGDWFNRVDFTKAESNWNIGIPLAQDNQARWDEIRTVSANPNSQFSSQDIQLTSSLFNEFLNVRATSKLFRLNSAEDIAQRIRFHNTGEGQIQGLIVMSLDDGIGLEDLDENNDAIVVLFNGTQSTQSFTISDATNFELHANQQTSADQRVQGATFNNGTFSVPALTTAIFVKPQNGEQGYGLSALPPYGDRTVYLRGGMNNWDTSLPLEYVGNDKYRIEVSLLEGSYEFKLADENFGVANIGGGVTVGAGQSATLTNGGNNLTLNIISDGDYTFELDAANDANPTLTITTQDPNAVPAPYGETTIYVRGVMGDWGTSRPMVYEGAGVYSISFNVSAGTHEFKVAEDNWSSPNLGSNGGTINVGESLTLQQGAGNIRLTVSQSQTLRFVVDATDTGAPVISVEMWAQ
ncbi:MAG: pullulanase-type alpha-1,6-glucosidase [Pseudomonadota bacterium]|nr:pullulanase-type alpha-1,6-glucosidase [Pseudomonadota bacterium]